LLVNTAADAGLVVRLVPPKAGSTHEEILRNVVKPASGNSERRSLNGLSATHFTGTVRNEQGQSSNVNLTLVSGPGGRNYLLQYAAKDAAALQRATAQMAEAEGSFRALTAADRAAAKPYVVKTVSFPRGGFAELAKSSPLTTRPEAQLRLLNGAFGGGAEPAVGQVVKVVG
jgi:predicted Zn-dependent protease